jgi:PqqD family protein of HPr-rel-A system
MNERTEGYPRKRGQAWVQRDGNETAVFNPDTGMLHMLNPSALAIWEMCDGETTPTEMAEAITEVTGLDREATSADVDSALASLRQAGLLQV